MSASSLIVGIDVYRASVPVKIPWVVEPLVYYGGVTLIAGRPKGGKSTLLSDLQWCREHGHKFLGLWKCDIGPTLLVTEESGVAVVYKTVDLMGLQVLDRSSVVKAGLAWPDVLSVIHEWATGNPKALIIIDTLAAWAEIQNENDASEMTARVGEVLALAATGAAVILVHHTRKGGGVNGEGVRGSSAIYGAVDIAAELYDHDPNDSTNHKRRLTLQGRVIMPQSYLLDYDGQYKALDWADEAEVKEAVWLTAFDNGPMTKADLETEWGLADRTTRDRIKKLLDKGLITTIPRIGNDPLTYDRAGGGGMATATPPPTANQP